MIWYILGASLLFLGAVLAVYLLDTRSVRPSAPEGVPATRSEVLLEVVEKLGNVQAELKSLRRQMDDLDESVDHRFKKFNARQRRAATAGPVAEEPEMDAADLFAQVAPAAPPPPNGASRPRMVPAQRR